jgi:hypothetical protein
MSTIVTSNVSDGTLSIPTTFVTNGSAKAWVNFNGTGTIAARDSLNVSSLTDNGTGDYTVNFSSAFGAADYSFNSTGNGADDGYFTGMKAATAPTASSASLVSVRPAVGQRDEVYVFAAIHGDLA